MTELLSPTPEQLAEWRRLADAATKGPWKSAWDTPPRVAPPDKTIYVDDEQQSPVVSVFEYNGDLLAGCTRENASFIAAARTAVPALLDERERLSAEVERLRARISALERAGNAMAEFCDLWRKSGLDLDTGGPQLAKKWRRVRGGK